MDRLFIFSKLVMAVEHEIYMRRAIELARQGIGRTSPNPMVGAVIVNEGRIVGEGWHKKAGTAHAEIHALNNAGPLAKGATVYVTLEPCSHYGRTGPCAIALIEAGVSKVVVAMTDPNPLVSGKGIAILRESGIEVEEGLLSSEAAKLNESFIKWISTGIPFIAVKTAVTLDGKIATVAGESQWITGSSARQKVHSLRDRYDAILVGIGTVLADNPKLTTRLPSGGKNPIRIIVDSRGRAPLNANVVCDQQAHTIIAVTENAPSERIQALSNSGVEVIITSTGPNGGVCMGELFKKLGERKITSILVEGGAAINGTLLVEKLIDKVYWFIAPKLVGGSSAPGPIGGRGITALADAALLEDIVTESIGSDLFITAYLRNREGRDVYRSCGRIGQG